MTVSILIVQSSLEDFSVNRLRTGQKPQVSIHHILNVLGEKSDLSGNA